MRTTFITLTAGIIGLASTAFAQTALEQAIEQDVCEGFDPVSARFIDNGARLEVTCPAGTAAATGAATGAAAAGGTTAAIPTVIGGTALGGTGVAGALLGVVVVAAAIGGGSSGTTTTTTTTGGS